MERVIRTLDEVDADSVALVGGKGANLGELVAAGVPVPAAFCVTTEAYRWFVDHYGLSARLGELLHEVDYSDPAGIEARASTIRNLILDSPVPEELAGQIATAYQALEERLGPGVAVSVRSSATAEDLPGMSFAGQQDTYLYISGREALIDAVRCCWSSLWTDRAIAYRHTQGFDHESVLLAVVVQEMFASEVSGVMFTANPLTSNPSQFFLNVSWGLGEAIVSGHVNPDQLIVDKQSLEVVDRTINEKLVMTARDASGQGSATVAVPDDLRRVQSLEDARVRELCELGQRIEEHFGYYQDIEWGFAEDRFAILQTREITGADLDLGRELELWKTPDALATMYDERWTWSRAYSDEVQTGPSTPSFYTVLQLGMTYLKAMALTLTKTDHLLEFGADNFLDFPYFRWYGARAYYNLAFERERIRRFIPPFARTEAALWPFPAEERHEIKSMPFDWDTYLGLLQMLHDSNPDVSLLGTTKVMYEGLVRWTAEEQLFWDTFDLDQASVDEILDEQMTSHTDSKFGENVTLPFTIYLYVLPAALEALCQAWLDDNDARIYNRLVGGLQTKTAEENIALWRLSRGVATSPELREIVERTEDSDLINALAMTDAGRQFLVAFDTFVAEYGHRGGAERDAYHMRWLDNPALIFQSLRLMIDLNEHQSPEAHEARQRAEMLHTKAECVARLSGESDDLGEFNWVLTLSRMGGGQLNERAEVFEWLVDLVQDYCYYRDYERFYNDKNMARPRHLYQAIGRKLTRAGVLDEVDDIFFLGREEMRMAGAGGLTARQVAHRVRSRRRVYNKYSRQEPPKYIRGWEPFDDNNVDAEGALVGIGSSSGVVTGTARVCRDLSEIGKVKPGDILVTVATDPGWTTVFSIVGGVVVETGGVVAHAVMISREYGLPCVANLTRACDEIPDGSTITIDGMRGRVVVHLPIEAASV